MVTREGEPEQLVAPGGEPLVIGVAPSSGLMLAAHEVSRAHCRIAAAGEAVSISDLELINGTFVDGQADRRYRRVPAGARSSWVRFHLRWEPAEEVEGTMRRQARAAAGAGRRQGTD